MTTLLQNKLFVVMERLVYSHCEYKYVEIAKENVKESLDKDG
jgi:hypothetical protein